MTKLRPGPQSGSQPGPRSATRDRLMDAPTASSFPVPRIGTEPALDRRAERRTDEAWLKERLARADTRFLLLVDLNLAVRSNEDRSETAIRWYDRAGIEALDADLDKAMLLGTDSDDRAVFAIALTPVDVAGLPQGMDGLKPLVDLRTLAMQGALSNADLSLYAMARGLAAWHVGTRCCGRCGGHTNMRDAGWRRRCWACGQEHFPRADPAVIVLITDGDRCLLGHHRRYGHKFYSTLAGFVEPGEAIEATVRREMREETGVEIGEVTYLASQPWPFPHTLMFGCWAEALTTEITLEEEELIDAKWFTRDDVRAMLEERHPEGYTVPGPHSIAWALITSFVDS